MWHRTIDCLGLAVGLSSDLTELAAPLAAVFRTYADTSRAADVTYALERRAWPCVVRDGAVASRHDELIDLVPALEIDLYARVTARARGLLLHAGAVVGAGGLALVVAGRSGAGKSTLVRALLSRGFGYLSEECVALADDGTCIGLARALHVDDEAVAVPAGFRCDPYVLRTETGLRRTRLLHPPEDRIWRGPARAVAVVAIDHAPDAADTLEPLTGGAALAALWPTVFRSDPAAIGDAAAGLARTARFRLHTAHPDAALSRVLGLAKELGVVPI